jgi:hypothetical protein
MLRFLNSKWTHALKYEGNLQVLIANIKKVMIILYIITVILVLTGVKLLTIAGIFFGICYLPGLAMFALIKKDGLQFEDLILAFPVSIGISALLTLGLLYIGVHVKFIFHILYGIIGFSVLLYIIKYKKAPSLSVKLSGREIRFIIIALLITLIFSIPVLSERTAISAHGFHHSTISTQILNGIFPPENPGLGGTTLSYHWGYHAFVAALSSPTNFPPLRVMSLLNVMSLFFIFCIAYITAKFLDFPEEYRYFVPLALIGLMRSDAVIFFINKLFSGVLMDLRPISFSEVRPSEILQSWIWGGGAPWFDRRLFFLNKFYNANTMPIGISLCLSYFLVLLIHLIKRHDDESNKIYLITLCLVLMACCIIYPPLAIIPLLHAPVWATFSLLSKRMDFKARFKEALEILIPYGLAVIIVFPYLLSISSNTNEPVIRINFYDQSIENIVAFWLPIPVIFAGVIFSFKKFPSTIFFFLIVAASLCLGLSIFTQVAFGNSAKFTFILSFFYALFFVSATSGLLHLVSKQWLKRFLSAGIILFLLITPIMTEAAYILSPWFRDNTYSFSGRHIVFAQDRKRNEAYTWIRNSTPPVALVMLTYVETSNPDTIAQNSTYEAAALTERNLFVVKDWYTFPNPEYTKRVSIREKLFLNYADNDVRNFFTSLNCPVYLLVEDELPPIYFTDEIFHNFPDDPEGLLLVFSNKRQRVYMKQR